MSHRFIAPSPCVSWPFRPTDFPYTGTAFWRRYSLTVWLLNKDLIARVRYCIYAKTEFYAQVWPVNVS